MKFLVRKAPENFIRTVNDEISSLLNRHFDSYFPEAAYWEDMEKFSMPVEMTDKGKDYEVKAELPGVKKEDLDIDIDKNYIVINAKKEEEKIENEKALLKSALDYEQIQMFNEKKRIYKKAEKPKKSNINHGNGILIVKEISSLYKGTYSATKNDDIWITKISIQNVKNNKMP